MNSISILFQLHPIPKVCTCYTAVPWPCPMLPIWMEEWGAWYHLSYMNKGGGSSVSFTLEVNNMWLLWLPSNQCYSLLSWNSSPIARMPNLWCTRNTGCYSDHPNQEQTIPSTIDHYKQSWVTTSHSRKHILMGVTPRVLTVTFEHPHTTDHTPVPGWSSI